MQYTTKSRMQKSDIALEKYWVTQSGYFILATTVALGMGITDVKLLLCHGISEQSKENNISMREYNDKTVYECFNNTFLFDYGSPYLNLPPIHIDDSHRTKKISWYTSDLLPSAIYFPFKILLVLSPHIVNPNKALS